LANNADEDHKDENDGEDDEDDSDVDSEEYYATSLPKEITNIFYLDGSYFFLMFFGV
jgi:hypothetical protein